MYIRQYTLLIGKKSDHRKYKTWGGIRRRLDMQCAALDKGATETAQIRVDTRGDCEIWGVTFWKKEDGSEWGWKREYIEQEA
jgi:hypothetical protein